MSEFPLPLSRPSVGEEEIREVVEVLRSGWLTSGPRVERFEAELARYTGAGHAVAVSSCTAGLHVALLAHGIGPGDAVVTSAMTWPATVNAIERVGARPIFADVDRHTLGDPDRNRIAWTRVDAQLLAICPLDIECREKRVVSKVVDRN